MITEDYISLETAKLLKEKGFELPSLFPEEWLCSMYDEKGKVNWGCYSKDWYCRITLQMAMKWLRKEHNIDIDITAQVGMLQVKRYVPIIKTYNPKFDEELGKNRMNQKSHSTSKPLKGEILPVYEDFATYEEACESAIKYCLENLI